jgi:GNAT superfamily N-acetyltransferase
MCDEWMANLQLPLSYEQFRQLPRNSAYKYEFMRGQVYLSPRPRHYHALLELQPFPLSSGYDFQPIQEEDLAELVRLFSAVFRNIQPFAGLDDAMRLTAAQQAIDRTLSGGDGPWIQAASFAARQEKDLVGAVFTTLLPEGDPCEWDSYSWQVPPPRDSIEQRRGRPHLTWIFVAPPLAGRGLGTALLRQAGHALQRLGFKELLSTFMIGNDSSMLWHWRNGFRLLSYPGSRSRVAQGW